MNVDAMRFDLLKELNNIGSGGALTSLSKLVNENIQINVPKIKLIEYSKISEDINYKDVEKLVGVFVKVEGELDVYLMFVLSVEAANAFISSLLMMDKQGDEFSKLELSVIQEMANIMFSAYVNTLTAMTNTNIKLSTPHFAIDMPQTILGSAALLYSEIAEMGIFVETTFGIKGQDFLSYLVMAPDPESYNKIAKTMGVGN